MIRTTIARRGVLVLALVLAVPAVAIAATRWTTRTVRLAVSTKYGTLPSHPHWYRVSVAIPTGHKVTLGQGRLDIAEGNGPGLGYDLLPYRSLGAYCRDSEGHAVSVGHGVTFCAGTTASIGRFSKQLTRGVIFVALSGEGVSNSTAEHAVISAKLR